MLGPDYPVINALVVSTNRKNECQNLANRQSTFVDQNGLQQKNYGTSTCTIIRSWERLLIQQNNLVDVIRIWAFLNKS